MKKVKCIYDGCENQGKCALYGLMENGTKVWRTDICSVHDADIAQSNGDIRKRNPDMVFKKVK